MKKTCENTVRILEQNSLTRKSTLYTAVPQRVGILLKANVQLITENHLREVEPNVTVSSYRLSPVTRNTYHVVRCKAVYI